MMDKSHNHAIARAVIRAKLVPAEQVRECLAEIERSPADDGNPALDELLVQKGLLTREQADAVLASARQQTATRTIAGFEIIQPIGKGGMHTVYKARQVSMDRIVALKILSPKLAADPAHVQRLFKEARAVAKLSHANIIQGIDVGEDSGYYYFAAEFVEGEPLNARLRREGKLDEREALMIAEEVAQALDHIHTAAGMIHGDVKPANIMLTSSGTAKLADLGLARAIGVSESIAAGSPHYISPEQARNDPNIDIRSDIYSLGATLFHMIAGSPPFGGLSAKEIIAKHLNEPVPDPARDGTNVSKHTQALIRKMMAKQPRARFQDPQHLLQSIRRIRKSLDDAGSVRRLPIATVAATLVVIAAGIAAGILLTDQRQEQTPPPAPVVQEAGQPDPAAGIFAEAAAFERDRPESLQRIARLYHNVVASYPDSDWAAKARQKKEAALARLEAQASETFNRLKARSAELAAQDRHYSAMLVWREYPDELAHGRWPERIKIEVSQLRTAAQERADEFIGQAEELAGRRQFAEAAEVLRKGIGIGLRDITDELNKRIAAYEQAAANAEQSQTRKAIEKVRRLETAVARHGLSRRFDLAAEVLDAHEQAQQHDLPGMLPKDTAAQLAADVAELKAEVETARAVWQSFVDNLTDRVGQEFEVRVMGILLRGTLRGVDESTFTIEMGGNRITRNLADIEIDTIIELAGAGGLDQQALLRKIRFCLAAGSLDNATLLAGKLVDKNQSTFWADRASRRRQLLRADNAEQIVRETIAQYRAAVEAADWKQAYKLLRTLRTDSLATEAAKSARDELDQLDILTEAGLCASLGGTNREEGRFLEILEKLRSAIEWQDQNSVPEQITCPTCTGNGYIARAVMCPRCGGARTIRCPRCSGRGYILTYSGRHTCTDCFGNGRVRCPTCSGRGTGFTKSTCANCRGTGKIVNPVGNGSGYRRTMPDAHHDAIAELKQRFHLEIKAVAPLLK